MYRKATCLLTGILLTAGAVWAQDADATRPDAPMIVSASGQTRLQRRPTMLRMYLQLTAKGKTLEEAMAAMKERREAAQTQLDKLGVAKGSVSYTGPSISNSVNARQKRMEMMISQRMGSKGKKAAKVTKPPVTLGSILTAEWPLEGDTPEKLLLAAESLREKITAADLAGVKEAEKLTPEEQEVADEMAEETSRMSSSDDDSAKPGQPNLLFVAKITPADRQAAVAKAFADAKTDATDLAKAAGADLGRLVSLSASGGGQNNFGEDDSYSRNAAYYMQRLHQRMGFNGGQANEAVASTADAIDFVFMVQATFKLDMPPAAK
jgi:uncharacterized protein YggE